MRKQRLEVTGKLENEERNGEQRWMIHVVFIEVLDYLHELLSRYTTKQSNHGKGRSACLPIRRAIHRQLLPHADGYLGVIMNMQM